MRTVPRARMALLLACVLLLGTSAGHGQSSVAAGAAAGTTVVHLDYRADAPGTFPSALQPMHGAMAVVQAGARRWLEATSKSGFVVPLGRPLDERFVIEFEVTLPPNGLVVYFDERWGVSERHLFNGTWSHPFVVLSGTEVGVRERPRAGGAVRTPSAVLGRTVANGDVVQLRIEGDASSLTVLLNGRTAATVRAVVPRRDRIFIETTGEPHDAARRSAELIPTRIGAISVWSVGAQGIVRGPGALAAIDSSTTPVVPTTATGSQPGTIAGHGGNVLVGDLPHVTDARTMREAGQPIGTTAQHIGTKYQLGEPAVATTLLDAGYTEQQIVDWLKAQGRTVAQAATSALSTLSADGHDVRRRYVEALWRTYGAFQGSFTATLVGLGTAPEDVVRGMHAAGATFMAQARPMFNGASAAGAGAVPGATGAAALNVQSAGHALWKVNSPPLQQFIDAMHQNGVEPGQMLVALADFYGLDVYAGIEAVGTRATAKDITVAAMTVGGVSAEASAAQKLALALRNAGHAAGEVAAGVWEATNSAGSAIAARLTAEAVLAAHQGGTAAASAQRALVKFLAPLLHSGEGALTALISLFRDVGVATGNALGAIRDELQPTWVQLATAAHNAGLAGGDAARELVTLASVPAASAHSWTAQHLRQGGYPAREVAGALRHELQATAAQSAGAMSQGGFTFSEIRDALVEAYGLTTAAVIQLLASLGIS
jgi:hypothetical protein